MSRHYAVYHALGKRIGTDANQASSIVNEYLVGLGYSKYDQSTPRTCRLRQWVMRLLSERGTQGQVLNWYYRHREDSVPFVPEELE